MQIQSSNDWNKSKYGIKDDETLVLITLNDIYVIDGKVMPERECRQMDLTSYKVNVIYNKDGESLYGAKPNMRILVMSSDEVLKNNSQSNVSKNKKKTHKAIRYF